MKPAVSVLLPVYRPQIHYLRHALESVLHQTFDDFEVLLVEAALETCIKSLLEELQDKRIKHLCFPGKASLVDQLNWGLEQTQCELVARMDADDWCFPERLAKQLDYMQQQKDIAVLGSQLGVMDSNDRPIGSRKYPTAPDDVTQTLRQYNAIAHPSVMYRKQAILDAGGYRYRTYPANEDYELWCRLAKQGAKLANLDVPLLRYRVHPQGMKSAQLKAILRGTRLVKRHYYGGDMTMKERSRYWAEGALLNLPGWVILELFKQINYHREC